MHLSIAFNRLLSQYLAVQSAALAVMDSIDDVINSMGPSETPTPESLAALADACANLERVLTDGGATLPNRVH